MKNLFTARNPYMAMWLSGANAATGAARGRMAAETRKQTQAVSSEAAKQIFSFWTGMLTQPKTKIRRTR